MKSPLPGSRFAKQLRGFISIIRNMIGFGTIALFLLAALPLHSQLPDDFYDQLVEETDIYFAVGLTFDDNGRMYTWHRHGQVKIWDDQHYGDTLIDILGEMAIYGDHGLLGFTLDPDFLNNGYFYLYYIVDQHHLTEFGTPNYNPVHTQIDHATIGRVTRYQLDANTDFTTIVPNSRTILVGKGISDGPPILHISHSGGMLIFGDDGSLLVCTGDGSDYDQIDFGSAAGGNNFSLEALQMGIMRTQEDVGTFRSQMVNSYSGKVIRIDPMTGDGYPSNPFYDPNDPTSAASRVWTLGLRQPFRMTLKPGSGSSDPGDGNPGLLYVGDVGGNQWEEVNLINEPGMNFGWPLYEGHLRLPRFDTLPIFNLDAPNPLAGGDCPDYFYFSDLIQPATHDQVVFRNPCDTTQLIPSDIPTFIHSLPAVGYRNKTNQEMLTFVPGVDGEGNPVGVSITDSGATTTGTPFMGSASLGGMFYTGEAYPPQYKNSYFHTDFFGQIYNMQVDPQGYVSDIGLFRNDTFPALTLAMNPVDENIYYIGYNPLQIRKLQYGGNVPPVAIAEALSNPYGAGPLTLDFKGDESYDPQNEAITYHWDFGNGNSATVANPTETFTAPIGEPTQYDVTLTVTDSSGASNTAALTISVNNTPPVVDIVSINDGDLYTFPEDIELNLEASVTDLEFEAADLSYAWQVHLHHNTHYHSEPIDTQAISHISLLPFGCQEDSYWYRVSLSVSDPAGLTGTDEVEIFPWCNGEIANFLDLRHTINDLGVQLEWTVANEVDIVNYELQRSGPDMLFRKVADIPGNGTSTSASEYLHRDNEPLTGENWYRLKAINGSGAFDFSPAIQVFFYGTQPLIVYPNPVEDVLYMVVDEVKGQFKLDLFNVRGQLVLNKSWESNQSLRAEIDLSTLRPGIYYYRVSNGSYFYRGKVMKD